ncbi:hypothetical protein E2C01_037700 [Portunus trituberculatus]|uniref:Uncharacterized protein n=1 Tax=Portunus trituberculatus TaxID=210409 RepID=A0A5B7FA18_PORTR|nr:hypothetical protein [Portunus trituberculatus]
MARPGVLVLLLLILVCMCDAFILCPKFPKCCRTRSCGIFCPSCSEAKFFVNGVRKVALSPPRCGLLFILEDPYLYHKDLAVYPHPYVCL